MTRSATSGARCALERALDLAEPRGFSSIMEGGRTAYAVLGAGYAGLAAAIFAGAALRRRQVARALARGEFSDVGEGGVLALTLTGLRWPSAPSR